MNKKGCIFLGCIVFLSLGCVSLPQSIRPKTYKKQFVSDYKSVWFAMRKATQGYTIKNGDIDTGDIVTELNRHSPESFKFYSRLESQHLVWPYYIRIQIIKLPPESLPATVEVHITKHIIKREDFTDRPEELRSDGMEELSLLYRISRELYLN